MFILLISRGVPSKRDPQWGCFEKDQAEALAAAGHKVVVISVDSRTRYYRRKPGITSYTINGVNYLDCFIMPGIILRKIFGYKNYYRLKRLQIKTLFKRVLNTYGKPDILYSHYLPNTYLALTLKNNYDLPLVGIEHWSKLNKDVLSKEIMWLGESTYHRCDAIISVSDSLRKRLLQHFNSDSTVVHNMVGSEFCGEYSLGCSDDRVRFVSTASLLHLKGFDLLISSFSNIKLPLDKWDMVIIGEGEERNNLQSQINDSGLQNNIHLVGRKNKDEIVKILLNSDVFVLPSRSENFSVAVLEALCLGLPVIASICGGIRECIDNTNGLLFPVEDVDALSNAIKEMYENHHKYDRKKIAEGARKRFSPSVIAQQLTDVFEHAINNFNKQ